MADGFFDGVYSAQTTCQDRFSRPETPRGSTVGRGGSSGVVTWNPRALIPPDRHLVRLMYSTAPARTERRWQGIRPTGRAVTARSMAVAVPPYGQRALALPAALLLVLLSTANANTSLVKAGGYVMFLFAPVGAAPRFFGALSVGIGGSGSDGYANPVWLIRTACPGPARYLSIRMGR